MLLKVPRKRDRFGGHLCHYLENAPIGLSFLISAYQGVTVLQYCLAVMCLYENWRNYRSIVLKLTK